MADFNLAYSFSRNNEGGYANDSRDTGGETYKGVSRVHNPKWAGWAIIDAYKKKNGPIKNNFVIPDPKLDQLVKDLFRANYWNPIKGDLINNQEIAKIMFDFALTSGPNRAAINAQRAAGVTADGIIGSDSLKAINRANPKDLGSKILKENLDYYTYLAKEHPKKENYAWAYDSWVSRIKKLQGFIDKLPGGAAGGAGMLIGMAALFFLGRKLIR
jgi:lysozyme family protein